MNQIFLKGFKALKFLLSTRYRDRLLADLRQNPFNRHLLSRITYKLWIIRNEPGQKELRKQRSHKFLLTPKISIIVPVYNTNEKCLKALLTSVLNQTYANWELCLVDGSDIFSNARERLIRKYRKNPRIQYKKTYNKGISLNSNEAIHMAAGDYLTFVDHDDVIAPFSLFEFVQAINNHPEADILYSDEDHLSMSNQRILPYFKPDFNKELLRSTNYICHQVVVRKSVGDQIDWLKPDRDGAQDHDFLLRATDITDRVIHIPKILYHWREVPGSAAHDMSSKLFAFEGGKKALEDHLKRLQINGTVTDGHGLGYYRIYYHLKEYPHLSVIIPNQDNPEMLYRCIESILTISTYRNFEILIIENNSTDQRVFELYQKLEKNHCVRILRWNMPFNFSAINNFGADHAKGEFLLFLNNDVQVVSSDWMERMLEHFVKFDIGIVGAKLYFPDDTIEHAGFLLGIRGYGSHSHMGFPRNSYGYFGRLMTVQYYSAVTGACLMTRRDVFESVNGFDEQFEYNYNDVDYCLRVKRKGYHTVWTPYAELYHFEAHTRKNMGKEKMDCLLNKERDKLYMKWPDIQNNVDPYYNPNLHPGREDFSIHL